MNLLHYISLSYAQQDKTQLWWNYIPNYVSEGPSQWQIGGGGGATGAHRHPPPLKFDRLIIIIIIIFFFLPILYQNA